MSEPLYTYVKGKGWITANNLFELNGQLYTYDFRVPVSGERYVNLKRGEDLSSIKRLLTARGTAEGYISMSKFFTLCVFTPVT